MRYFLLTVVGLLLVVHTTGQTPFRHLFSGYGAGLAVAPSPVGGMVIASRITKTGQSFGAVLKLDATGAPQWQRLFGTDEPLVLDRIVPAHDGGYLCAGLATDTATNTVLYYFLLKISESGATEWAHKLPLHVEVVDLIALAPDGYLLLTTQNVMRLDISGAAIWQYDYSLFYALRTAAADPDGNIYLAGAHFLAGGNSNVCLLKIQPDGNVIWVRDYAYTRTRSVESIAYVPGGGIVLGGFGTVDAPVNDGFVPWVMKTDTAGQPAWAYLYRIPDRDQVGRVAACVDGDVLLNLHRHINENNAAETEARIVRLDPQGNIRWANAYGSHFIDDFSTVRELPDGSLAAVGHLFELDFHGWVGLLAVRATAGGALPGCCVRASTVERYDWQPTVIVQSTAAAPHVLTTAAFTPNATDHDNQPLDLCDLLAPYMELDPATVCPDTCVNLYAVGVQFAANDLTFSGIGPGSDTLGAPYRLCLDTPGEWTFSLTSSWMGCTSTISDTISVRPRCACPPGEYPDAFTPNGDSFNDKFLPGAPCDAANYVYRIFNRWGQIVFETTDLEQAWDGTVDGQPGIADLYVWHIAYRLAGQENVHKSGPVTLLR